MLKFLSNSLFFLFRLFIVLAINFALFLVIPLTNQLFGSAKNNDRNLSLQPKIVAEYIKPPKKEDQKQPQRQIRQVQSSQSSHSSQKSMNFKFTPDLGTAGNGDGVAMASQELNIVVFEEGETDEEAKPINRPQIPYPQRAKELGIEGDLVMVLLIDTDGKVASVEIVNSPDQSISKAAKECIISSWKFKPARNQGVPVKQRLKQKISFKLN